MKAARTTSGGAAAGAASILAAGTARAIRRTLSPHAKWPVRSQVADKDKEKYQAGVCVPLGGDNDGHAWVQLVFLDNWQTALL